MRQSPPAHYRAYWRLQENEKELDDLASHVMLRYMQNWGQQNEERLSAMQRAAIWVGFKVEVVKQGEEFCFKVPDEQSPLFDEMRQKIRNIRRGNWEGEVVQIASILKSYKAKSPRWFWQKWPKTS